ncbi:unnamed protein product [Alternaria sp. RS040]
MPLSNLWAPNYGHNGAIGKLASLCGELEQRIFDDIKPTTHDLSELTQQLFAFFAPGFNSDNNQALHQTLSQTLNDTQNLLEVAMFVANRAILTLVSTDSGLTGRQIYTSPGVVVPKPVLSRSSVIIMSVLIGLQLLGLGYLAHYLYRVPSWSDQLDAMAIARIGASLDHQGVLPAIGPVSKEDLVTLQTVGGLIGIVERSPCHESSATESVLLDMAAADDSAVELQRLTSSEEARKSVKDDTTNVKLELGASGPIRMADLSDRTTLSSDLKRAWSKMFASERQPSVDDLPSLPTSPRSETSTNLPTLTLLPSLSFSTHPDDDEMSILE